MTLSHCNSILADLGITTQGENLIFPELITPEIALTQEQGLTVVICDSQATGHD